MKHTIIVISENKPGVLYRVADLFLRRKVNIDNLSVAEVEQTGFSRFNIVISVDSATADKISKQLYKIIEVTEVQVFCGDELIQCLK